MKDANEFRKELTGVIAEIVTEQAEITGRCLINAAQTAKPKIESETSSEMKMQWVNSFLERFRSIIDEFEHEIEPYIQQANEAVFELRLHGEE